MEQEKQCGVNEGNKNGSGKKKGSTGYVDIKVIQASQNDGVDTGWSASGNKDCTKHHRVVKKLRRDKVTD